MPITEFEKLEGCVTCLSVRLRDDACRDREKRDLKRELDQYRAKRGEFRLLEVPPTRYLMVDGHGGPDSADYADALAALFPVAYGLKFASKRELGEDYVVMPLEALWSADDPRVFATREKSAWDWTAMIMTPDWITRGAVRPGRRGDRAQGCPGVAGEGPAGHARGGTQRSGAARGVVRGRDSAARRPPRAVPARARTGAHPEAPRDLPERLPQGRAREAPDHHPGQQFRELVSPRGRGRPETPRPANEHPRCVRDRNRTGKVVARRMATVPSHRMSAAVSWAASATATTSDV